MVVFLRGLVVLWDSKIKVQSVDQVSCANSYATVHD